MVKLQKILKICRYALLSAVLLVFAVARIPFGGGDKDDKGNVTGKEDLDSLLLKVHADVPPDGDGDDGDGDD